MHPDALARPMPEIVQANVPAVGHYSAGAIGAGLLFVSGQGPMDPMTGRVIEGDFRAKARQCLANIETVLQAAGGSRADIVKTTVFLHDWADFPVLNEVFAEFFGPRPPARSTVQGSRPPGHLLAIEAVALAPRS